MVTKLREWDEADLVMIAERRDNFIRDICGRGYLQGGVLVPVRVLSSDNVSIGGNLRLKGEVL